MYHQTRWTISKLQQRYRLIETLIYRQQSTLPAFRFQSLTGPLDKPPTGLDTDDSQWEIIEPRTYWAAQDTTFTLRCRLQVPGDWTGPVSLVLPLGDAGDFSHPEALAYLDGVPFAACDRHHQELLLPAAALDGQAHLLALHGWSGSLRPDMRLLMRPCLLVQVDQPTRDFAASARVALGIAAALDENNPTRGELLNTLDHAFKLLDTREPFGEVFYASVPAAHAALRQGIESAGPALDVRLTAAGHAHIDVAWLWTLGQTRRKAGRTFHTVLHLMQQFPDYHYSQSQPQLYDFVRQDYPSLFETIKQRVADGRWEPLGGMWVEADCNLSGPESLARQFLLGRRFFRQHFGADAESPVLWLPDVFGYSWALPQLIKLAGLQYFMTIKLSWSQYNRLPYDSFWWQGIDGTRVLTHFSTTPVAFEGRTASNYNAMATPREVLGTWHNFQQKELQHDLLMSYGYGDGGGGPTREMLENIREMVHFPATPQVRFGKVGDFFQSMEAEVDERMPIWNGELYLEMHRGTYTTQSRNKRANRKSEFLLHDAEFLAALASVIDTGYTYPADQLREAWELVCLNQFHDIIPGSSITAVYAESQEQYAAVAAAGEAVRRDALATIARQTGGDIVIANPTAFARTDLAFWTGPLQDGKHLETADGTPVLAQVSEVGGWLSAGTLAPYSVTPLRWVDGPAPAPAISVEASPAHLENDFVRVEINPAGDIVRIYDKAAGREVLPPGAVANQFQAFEDRPLNWDAWDVDIFYDDRMWTADPAQSVKVVEAGPLRATLEIKRRILNTNYTQRISLHYNSPQIYFDTDIDWQERHILLKTAFPVDILAPQATYEIQWGNVQRPTHHNTSWDWARFETCAQKWVDLSEGGYGVSLINDCKYGHDIHDNVMRISLLRGTTEPDPVADLGQHQFAYSLLPHAGDWTTGTIPAAYALNDPLIVASGVAQTGTLHPAALVSVDQDNIVIETIKRAEDGRGLIVRLYESQRRRGVCTLTTAFDLRAAIVTNLIEDDEQPLQAEGRQVRLTIRPYQIVTLRLLPD